jgi:hypothetical protein
LNAFQNEKAGLLKNFFNVANNKKAFFWEGFFIVCSLLPRLHKKGLIFCPNKATINQTCLKGELKWIF